MRLRIVFILGLAVVSPELPASPTQALRWGPAPLAAQAAPVRRSTNVAMLGAYPSFYHLRPITVIGELTRLPTGELRLKDESREIRVIYAGSAPDGPAELRGEFWDLGRMNADDPRLGAYDLRKVFQIDPDRGWPRSGEVLAIVASDIGAAAPPPATTIRSVVLNPSRYLDREVTITGQFAGRNLLGDLPDAPAQSQYDFVLRSADAAIWVSNLRPRGRDFELSLDTRIDTGRWAEVTGTLKQARGLLFLDAEGNRIALRQAPADTPLAQPIVASKAPPPEVIFSMPAQNEVEVTWSTPVRIQFSREIDQSTLKDRVRVRYLDEEARILGEPDTPVANFTMQYTPSNNVLELRFTQNLERYRTIKVDLLEGILATDKQPLAPWTLTFIVGSH